MSTMMQLIVELKLSSFASKIMFDINGGWVDKKKKYYFIETLEMSDSRYKGKIHIIEHAI